MSPDPLAEAMDVNGRLIAELQFARADNARLIAENKKLGETIERLLAEREALVSEDTEHA